MLIAQISDTHLVAPGSLLYDEIDVNLAFTRCLERLLDYNSRPDLLIISGDLADSGDIEAYTYLADLLAPLPFPTYLLPGNHDLPDNLRTAFPHQQFLPQTLCCQKVSMHGRSLLLLDTQVPGQPWGEISDTQMAWLDSVIGDEPALLFMHHPPFKTGIAGMDWMNCRNEDHFEKWLLKHKNIKGIYCGHMHRFVASVFAGLPVICAPAPAHQIALDLSGIEEDLACVMEPGSLLLHFWPGDETSRFAPVSHNLLIDKYPSYFIFR